ncbi:hypothetical protein Daus18300_009818 [Diaporthe australafricana]|uniref:Short-chain dehydrogenase n=1 Tax=Diaporthe australafricana TaxID=127596 RepID=A0ABR3WD29_9PEZI
MARLAPYYEQHKLENVRGPGDSRPTAAQIIEDQGLTDSPEWAGRVVLITGVSPGGLGLETAKAIHLTGADVYITSRNLVKGKEIAEEIRADGKPGKVDVVQLELDSLDSVRTAASEFLLKSGSKLNILINNAGIMGCPKGQTKDGFELQFGTNHLGHFLLFQLLKDALLASASPTFNSRVISVSSCAHRGSNISFDDLNFEKTEYTPLGAYKQSKLANILFANELDRRYQSQSLRALSLHPGGILTPIARYMPSVEDMKADEKLHRTLKDPGQGAATTVWGAVAKEWEGKGGVYLDEVAEGWLSPPDALYYHGGYAPQAFDPETEKKLWDVSLKLTGMDE